MSDKHRVITGDCLRVMPTLPRESFHAIVTDPPYGLSFMGKEWDRGVPGVDFWRAALDVALPGAVLVAFGGTRTFHRLTCAIEDAGWEIRDCLCWLYGSGFPKSLDVSKAIDAARGNLVLGDILPSSRASGASGTGIATSFREKRAANPQADAAKQWSGWGTALKPAWEPIILARKPLAGTVAANVQAHGCGALNIDGTRIGMSDEDRDRARVPNSVLKSGIVDAGRGGHQRNGDRFEPASGGRWPANVALDEDAARMLGEPSRFFYTAKASKAERNGGLDPGETCHHPTVKPLDLMRWLCRLVTPPGGLILDPFCGSGTTGKAAMMEGFGFTGIELNADYADIARKRIVDAAPLFMQNPPANVEEWATAKSTGTAIDNVDNGR